MTTLTCARCGRHIFTASSKEDESGRRVCGIGDLERTCKETADQRWRYKANAAQCLDESEPELPAEPVPEPPKRKTRKRRSTD